MLNVHSFLQGIKKRMIENSEECFRSCLLVAAYTLVAIILVLSSNSLSGKSGNVIEAYAKTEEVPDAFIKASEETAEAANIQADQNEENVPEDKDNQVEINAFDHETASGIVREAVEQVQEEQRIQKQLEAKAKRRAALKKAKAKAKRIELEKKKAAGIIVLPASEKKILQTIVEAEATGEDLKGRILVANVILNRVKSKQFPNTVKEVVFQRNGGSVQFSPTSDGRYWTVVISKKSRQAVEKALSGVDYSKGALYFSARSRADKSSMRWFDGHLKWLFKYGGHEFYTNR